MKKLLTSLLLTLALVSPALAQSTISQGGTGLSTSTVGDLLVGTSSLRYSRLPVGASGTVLQASSTSPFRMAWVALSSIFSDLLSSNNIWTGTNNFSATTTINKLQSGSSAGVQFFSNSGSQVADFGAGGGDNASFLGGVNITGNLLVNTNALSVNSITGNVGIGTSTPTSLLSVASSTASGTSRLFSIGASSEIFTVLANGNVGVGTAVPGQSLTVSGARGLPVTTGTTQNGMLRITPSASDGGTVTLDMGIGITGVNNAWLQASDRTALGTNYSLVLNPNGGNVGIGTSTPLGRLHVSTSNSGLTSISSSADEMVLDSSGATGMTITSGTSSDASIFFADRDSATVGRVVYGHANNTLSLWTNAVQRMTIDSSGNTGIGTTTPTSRLHVMNSGTQNAFTIASSSENTIFAVTSEGNLIMGTTSTSFNSTIKQTVINSANSIASIFKGSGSASVGIGSSGSSPIIQGYTNETLSATTALSLNPNGGNVGIGTTTPTVKLDVSSGNDGTVGVRVAGTAIDSKLSPSTLSLNNSLGLTNGSSISGSSGQLTYNASANGHIWQIGGTERVRMNSTGNVGIGTTTPTALLTVASSTGSGSTKLFNIVSSLGELLSVFASGQVLFSTGTAATCGLAPCGVTVATTTQFTAGVVSRVVGYASAASTTINLNTTDIATTTVNRATTFVNPTGTAYDGSMFEIRAKATTTQTVYWDTVFASSTDLTNVSTIASGTTRFLFEYRQDVGKWELVGLLKTFLD